MPKRKRDSNDHDEGRIHRMRKKDISEKLAQSQKLLHRALKTAKGFERQKLSKRLKNATTQKDEKNIVRINREIDALKGLDLDTATNAYLYRNILKVKAFAESEFCPEEVRREIKRPEGEEEALVALHNVTSNMYNAAVVKECMKGIMNGLYMAFGIPAPVGKTKWELKKGQGKDKAKEAVLGVSRKPEGEEKENIEVEREDMRTKSEDDPPTWEGHEDEHQDEKRIEGENEDGLDEEELSRYDALIGGSSDEESFDEEEYDINRPAQPTKRLSLSLSPGPSHSPSSSPSVSLSPEPAPSTSKPSKQPSKPAKTSKPKPLPAKAGLSTFLPTLMGGYWSGSESSASDLEDHSAEPAPIRKNRPGQMARRAIWEKKFGDKANHIKTGQGPVTKSKDDGWDAKRGARESGERGEFRGRGRGGGFGGRGGGRQRNYSQVTGENAIEVGPRKTGIAKKDDVGVLHPSWQAAKKAKEIKKTATFQGKKVTFD